MVNRFSPILVQLGELQLVSSVSFFSVVIFLFSEFIQNLDGQSYQLSRHSFIKKSFCLCNQFFQFLNPCHLSFKYRLCSDLLITEEFQIIAEEFQICDISYLSLKIRRDILDKI